MRVLFLAPHPFFQNRGTPIAERAYIEALAERGDSVDLVTYGEGEDVELPALRIHRIRQPRVMRGVRPGFSWKKIACDLRMIALCGRLAREGRYDLVHAVEESVFMAREIKRRHGIPYVYDMDSSLSQQMVEKHPVLGIVLPLLERMEKTAIRDSLATVTVCRALEEIARRCAPGVMVERIEDFSLLTGDEAIDEELSLVIGLQPGRSRAAAPIVLYAGNLERYQGVDLLVEAFAIARRSAPEARLVVIGGTSSDIAALARKASRLGLADRAHFLGPRPLASLGGYLRQAAVLVSPRTRGLNTPMKIFSYMDSGVPILATRLPTHTQVLDDGTACLVEPTTEAMARGLEELLANPARARAIADAARRRAREHYSREAYRAKVDRFRERLKEALRPNPEWALALYRRSVIKQRKVAEIMRLLPDPRGLLCLDIGGDNGVVSLLLRRRGGDWRSADLDAKSVDAIRDLVGGEIHRLDGGPTSFAEGEFDLVVIIDFLEHIANDRGFAAELGRIVKPGGKLIVNVPHLRPRSATRRIRDAIGLTDAWHGHLRPGYNREKLRRLFSADFDCDTERTYSRFFSEMIDTALNWAAERRAARAVRPGKGTIITRSEIEGMRKQLAALAFAYPFLRAAAAMDALLFFLPGHKLIARFTRRAR